jgi:hypothetical protein
VNADNLAQIAKVLEASAARLLEDVSDGKTKGDLKE